MRRTRLAFVLLPLAVPLWMSGCGGSAPTVNTIGVVPTHGGALIPLPGGRGFAEILVEPTKNKKAQIVTYFVKADGSGPIDPAPSDVSFTPEQGAAPLSLASKSGRFESAPAANLKPGRELSGELSANMGGEVVKTEISAR